MALSQHGFKMPSRLRARVPLLKRWSERVRTRHLFMLDAIGLLAAAIVAITVWLDQPPTPGVLAASGWIIGIVVFSQVAVNILLGLYTTSWRYASVDEMWRILGCTLGGSVAAVLIIAALLVFHPPVAAGMPSLAFWMLEAMLTLVVLASPRFMIRTISALNENDDHHGQRRTLLYGAGWAGVVVARSAERSPDSDVVPVGFLDDNLDLRGRRVAGLPVFGDTGAIARAKRLSGATSLLITMPRATGENVRRVVDAALFHGLDVRTVPAITDLIDGKVDARQSRRVRVEDLLRRPPVTAHSVALKQLLSGRTVMVTGAGGSIGSELVRQVLALEPARIVMVDQAESAMYMVARDLEARSRVMDGSTSITTHLVDVTHRETMNRLMREARPVVVFHAAAYKHVPMLEEHAGQAARVNIGGTMSVVDAAIENGVERFVLVSTDKAVRPTSVMGATKRVAEMVVSDAAGRTGRAFVSVRFGNVLGSNGSVIPVLQSQLENDKPLTITDPEMTRYFMTIPEASWLILDAAALSASGSLYVLDMGEPVRVMELAKDLVRLSGRDPESVDFRFIGLRPGEKLHEELFYANERVAPTEVPKVLRSDPGELVPETLQADLERFLGLARAGRDDELKVQLLAYVGSPWGTQVTASERTEDSGAAVPTSDDLWYRPVVPVSVSSNGSTPTVSVPSGNGNGSHPSPARVTEHPGRRDHEPDDEELGLLGKRIVVPAPAIIRVEGDREMAGGRGGADSS